MRQENEIWADLEIICSSVGYSHTIAHFVCRDSTIFYKEDDSNYENMFSYERLIRNEISTLIGLLIKKDINISHPGPQKIQTFIDETQSLLNELHGSMYSPVIDRISKAIKGNRDMENPLEKGDALREAIFYSSEGSHDFQYLELAQEKYKNDSHWLTQNKGFCIHQACTVVSDIRNFQESKLEKVLQDIHSIEPQLFTLLPAYTFSITEICQVSSLDEKLLRKIVEAFCIPQNLGSNSDLGASQSCRNSTCFLG